MVRTVLSTLVLLTMSASMAQTAKPASFKIDGKSAQAFTINGKIYVSLDNLKSAGLNVSGNAIYILTNPIVKQPAYKLGGCVNEWLWNGATRLRVDSVELSYENLTPAWLIKMSTQAAIPIERYYTDNKDLSLYFSNGDVIKPQNPSYVRLSVDITGEVGKVNGYVSDFGRYENRILAYRSDAESPSDAPSKLVLPQIRISGVTYPAMNFDLTCKK